MNESLPSASRVACVISLSIKEESYNETLTKKQKNDRQKNKKKKGGKTDKIRESSVYDSADLEDDLSW